ncbi:MAG: circadian clock KaiB family protein [Dermatophilaceae bacterium]
METHERAPNSGRLRLSLFVSGTSSASAQAERRLRDLCDQHAPSGYDLRVVDIYEQPAEVFSRGVLAVPTLFKELPPPVRMLIGDFTDESRVLAALGLSTRPWTEPSPRADQEA